MFYGLQMKRSLLKETGIPGVISVFSKESDLLDWIKVDRAHRRQVLQKEFMRWLGPKGAKWIKQYQKERLDKDIVERDEMDDLYDMIIHKNQDQFQKYCQKAVRTFQLLKG